MISEQIKSAFETKRNAVEELRSLYADAAGAELTGEQIQTEERLNAAIDGANQRIANLVDLADQERSIDESVAAFEARHGKIGGERRVSDPAAEERAAVEAVLRGESTRARIEYRDNVTLVKGTATDGAELVPTTLYNRLWEHMVEESPILQTNATVLRTAGGEDLVLPKTTSYSAASLVSENTQIGKDAPQFGTATLGAYKLGFLVQVSRELLQDSAFPVVDFVVRQGGRALGRGADTYFVTGSGTNQPKGIDNATVGRTTAANNAITYEDLIDTVHSVIAPARQGASWMFNDATIKYLRKLRYSEITANDGLGAFIWQPSVAADRPDTLLGYPVWTDPNIETIGSAKVVGVFGNFEGFYIRQVGAVDIVRSDDFAFDYDVTTYRFITRVDSEILDDTAFRTLKMAT